MANVKFSRKEFEKQVKITKEIEKQITLFGTPLESLNDEEIEIEIFPDRPDLLSLQGYLRAFKAFLGKESGLKKYKLHKSGKKMFAHSSLPKEWPYAYACIVRGLKFDDEKIKAVIDLQEKIGSTLLRTRKKGGIGLYPLEKITFPVTFKGMSPDKIKFRPLEFPREITGRQILYKHPTGRTYGHLCEDWKKFPVFVDAKGKIMSMPPIINSHDLGKIDHSTKEVFLEITGTDSRVLKKALNIMVTSLAEMGGKVYTIECMQQGKKKEQIPNLNSEKMKVSLENTNALLGLSLKEKDLEKLLPKMGYDYKKPFVSYPAWRSDILHEVDIIEDVAIAYGYEKITPEIPEISTVGQENPNNKISSAIADMLAGLGFLETSSYHLVKPDEIKKAKVKDSILVSDSKTEYKYLRPSLLIPTLRILSENKDATFPQKIFELGTVFKKNSGSESGVEESQHLSIAITPGNFTELAQVLQYLSKMLNITLELEHGAEKGLIEGRTGNILLNKKKIGFIGEAHPDYLKSWNIKMPLAILEISLDQIYNLLKK